jgi:hypothetical protein
MVRLGNEISGIRSMGRRVSEMAPRRTITADSMYIVTGRWMAMRGMLMARIPRQSS